ncbi:MAG: hypothetical protein ACR2P3_06760 [Geminicoccaceae bacterium]
MNENTSTQTFNADLAEGELDEIHEVMIEMSRLKQRMQNLPRHRHYSIAITKMDEARLWLGDRRNVPA